MGVAFHTMYAADGLENFEVFDRIFVGVMYVTYASGSATATVSVTWTEPVPMPYFVDFDVPENAAVYASSRTSLGFTANIAAKTSTLAGGTLGVMIFA